MTVKQIPLEDAMLMTGFGKHNIYLFALCALITIGMVFETLGFSFIIPAAQCDLQLSLTQKGWLGAIPFVGIIVTSHLWGWLADTRGRKPVIMWSTAVGSILSLISSMSPNLLVFAIFRFIAGLFIAGPTAVIFAYLGEFNNPRYRDRMVTLLASFIGISTLILPALAWLIYPFDFKVPVEFLEINYRPWRLLLKVFALPYLISAILMTLAPESPKFLACQGRTVEAFDVIKSIYRGNKGSLDEQLENIEIENMRVSSTKTSILRSMLEQTVPLFQKPLLFYMCIACFRQFGTFSNGNGFYLWIPEIFNKILKEIETGSDGETVCEILSPNTNLYQNTTINSTVQLGTECFDTVYIGTFQRSVILGFIYTPFFVVCGFMVHILGKRNLLIIFPAVAGIASYAIHWTTNQSVALVLLGVMQIDAVNIGMMNAFVVEYFPTHLRAMAVSLSLMFGRIGSIMGSNLIGYLLDVACPTTFFLFGTILLACSAVCCLLPKPPKEANAG